MPDSSLLARRLAVVPSVIVAARSYLERRGRPIHPSDLAAHDCFGYAYQRTRDTLSFTGAAGDTVTVRPTGCLRVNNGDALIPAAVAGLGIAALPWFLARDAVEAGTLEVILADWRRPDANLFLLTPPNGPRPARVRVLIDFLVDALSERDG